MQTPLLAPPARNPSRVAPTALSLIRTSETALDAGLDHLVSAFPARFTASAKAQAVRFRRVDAAQRRLAIRVESPGEVLIEFSRPCEAFRALGIVMGRLAGGLALKNHAESAAFESLGVMLDVSRNGVLRPETVRKMIRHLALMGVNRLMLYTEDTYEIPGEPLFGYFRGGYTRAELAAIDDYAALFGVEVVPCIQTLGHLEQVLHWPPYQKLQDTGGVLLAGDPATDAFVEKMITAAAAPFRSRRIHIGMDEAHGIGSGHYRLRNGLRPPFDILNDHLTRTADTCRRLGLQPMIWSDMFFRLGSKTNHYYDRASVVSPEVAARVPADVDLVYWDYYHTDQDFYEEWIARHRAMGKEPVFAGGIWTWNRWWAQLPHSIATLRAGMTAARKHGLKEAFVTMWGDDGMECDIFSALPGIQFFAELGYGDADAADENLPTHLLGSSDATASSWIAASDLDLVPRAGDPEFDHANPAKWMLWHDPLLSFLDRQIHPDAPRHYERLAARCTGWASEKPADIRLDFAGRLASVLALKTALHLALRPAYRTGDRATLRELLDNTLPALVRETSALRELHEKRWHELYRPFGWEVVERRYAGLLSRLDTLARKLHGHLATPSWRIEELDCESHQVWAPEAIFSTTLSHHQAATPSRIS